jgi:small neutral amino acid transporter SnatA (MarC family)
MGPCAGQPARAGGYRSGQTGLTVNQVAQPSEVRTLFLPLIEQPHLIVIYVLLRFASVIGSHLSPTLSRAITRVVGLLIMAIAVHFIAAAIGEWYHNGVI